VAGDSGAEPLLPEHRQMPLEFVNLRDVASELGSCTIEALVGPPLSSLLQFFEGVRARGGADILTTPSTAAHTAGMLSGTLIRTLLRSKS